ncbi:hypothetical protein A3F65_03530 [Candidatus Saccharibacteria bacterium RIFCSPHIGHO2_12_FULL_47_16b]|nr:MAG: hypothetical protein A3F65_03530 [Candidatus Saccharibacteria bacterium RIFCSPHIGHO2_12_FULL_47_16b]
MHHISFHPDERIELFSSLPLEEQTELLLALTPHIRRDLLVRLPENELVAVLEKLDPDDATDMLQLLGKHKRQKILEHLSYELRDMVSQLLEFDPNTAAGLMNVDYVQVDINDEIATVAKKFKLHEKRTGRSPIILVIDDGRLAGFLPGHELGFTRPGEKIKPYIKHIRTIKHSASHDEVTELFRSHPHSKVAVVNDNDDAVGIIYSDDVLNLLKEQESATLYGFAGVSAEETVTDSAKRKVKFRYKWLIINLATAFLAAATVSLFQDTISKYVLLAVYMPIVAGMGGNAATQTLAVVVRGIALRQIDLRSAYATLRNELGAGFVNGLINGFIVALVVLAKDHEPAIALVLALAMVINLLVAAAFGTIVPLVMSRLHKDPASSATVFITTATDVLGFMAFLGLATIILA